MLYLKCYIESFCINIILEQNKIVEHVAANHLLDLLRFCECYHMFSYRF